MDGTDPARATGRISRSAGCLGDCYWGEQANRYYGGDDGDDHDHVG